MERRGVGVELLLHLLVRQRLLGLLPLLGAAHVLFVDGLGAAELDHRVLEEEHLWAAKVAGSVDRFHEIGKDP